MSDWKYDWDLPNKFVVLCHEYNGEIHKKEKGVIGCEFEDYDDFKSFSQWMNKQKKDKKTSLYAKYTYMDLPATLEIDFVLNEHKSLNVAHKEKYFDDTFHEELSPPRTNEEYFRDDLHLTSDEEKKCMDSIVEKYLKNDASVDTLYGEDSWETNATVNTEINKGKCLQRVIEDAEKVTKKLLDCASEHWNKKIDAELERIKKLQKHKLFDVD